MQMVRAILKHENVRRFAASFGTVFCLGGVAVVLFLRTANSDAVDAASVVRFADGKSATIRANEGPASISIKKEQDLPRQTSKPDDYRVAARSVSATNDQSAEISDSFRTTSSDAMDRQSVGQAVYVANTNVGLVSSSNGGSFTVGNSSAASQQQSSTAPTSQTNASQMNDFPGMNEPTAADKPLLGKMPRGYTYEQLLYRTWYGWGASDWAQYQAQH